MTDTNVVESWIVDPQAGSDNLEAKQPYIEHGTEMVDPERYSSRSFMNLEWDRMWTKTWLIAGVETDIPEPGDYSVFTVGSEEIIVVRQEDGSVRALYNVCPHRGNRIVLNERGSMGQFTCAFHSWKFDLDGSLLEITDKETFRPETICHGPRMTEVKCETKAGLIFINMDPEAPPLEERLGLPDGYLEQYEIDKMVVVRHIVSEWKGNWKTGIDAFYETYHLHIVHPQTQGVMLDIGTQYDLYPHGASRMIVPIGAPSPRTGDTDSINETLAGYMQMEGMDPEQFKGNAQEVRKALAAHKRERAKKVGLNWDHFTDGQLTDSWATGIFPNIQIGMHPEGVFLMRFLPHATDPEKFYYDTMTLFRPAPDPHHQAPFWMGLPEDTDLTGKDRPETEHLLAEDADLGEVLNQDVSLITAVQGGVKSRGFEGPIWGEQEQRIRHFHAELDAYINGEK